MGINEFQKTLNEKDQIVHYKLLDYLISTQNFANYAGCLYHYDEATGAWCDITNDAPNMAIHSYIPQEYQTRIDAIRMKRIVADLINCAMIALEFENHNNFLNVENGVLNLTSLQVNDHNRRLGFKYMRRFKYSIGADIKKAPAFCTYLLSSLGCDSIESEEVEEVLQMIGYVVSDMRNAEKSVYLVGESNVGKSLLLKLLELAFDENEISSVGLHELGSPFRFAALANSYMNSQHELKPVRIKCVDQLKKVVSCEPVIAEKKGKMPIRISPRTVLVSATNNMPLFEATELNNSLVNRMLVIRFLGKISQTQINRKLFDQLKAEKDIIFSVAINYLQTLIRNRMVFTMPESTKIFMDAYARSLNSVSLFVEERCELETDNKVFSKDIYRCYVDFTRENMLYTHSFLSFGAVIRSLTGVENKKIRIGNRLLQGYDGIGLKK